MGREVEREAAFDAFYQATRRSLVHQTFALTGDLPAATAAVRDAYVAAWHLWRKVSRLPDPAAWVRPRAWEQAQRRHTARIWHRTKGLDDEHRATLDALAKLTTAQRRVFLLTQIAAVPLPEAARELSMTREVAEHHLQGATAALAIHLDVDSTTVRVPVDRLGEEIVRTALPRASTIRRAGRKRRQSRAVAALAAAVAVVVGSGALAYDPGGAAVADQDLHLVRPSQIPAASGSGSQDVSTPTPEQLLDDDQIRRLGAGQQWRAEDAHDNTSGDGIHSICQQARFADPDGTAAWVRSYAARGTPKRSAVQTVEVSDSGRQAKRAFRTTLQWYADCRLARLQVLGAYDVEDIGDEATVLMLRVWEQPASTYSVGVARIGNITTTTVGTTVGAAAPPATQIVQSLADSVAMLCGSATSEGCAKAPTFTPVPPPPAGAERGILAIADLPPVGSIDFPWVGTRPVATKTNPAATTCDQADFTGAGATSSRTRTFLIPEADLPVRFGLTETYGVFGSPTGARKFMSGVRGRVARCEDRDLSTTVTSTDSAGSAAGPRDIALWGLRTEVSEKDSVRFRVGFVRVENRVAQLTFAPTADDDIPTAQYLALLQRAGDRLLELDSD